MPRRKNDTAIAITDVQPAASIAAVEPVATIASDTPDMEQLISLYKEAKQEEADAKVKVDSVRSVITEVISVNGKQEGSWGRAELTQDATVISYDYKQVDSIMAELTAAGHPAAKALAAARKQSSRAGGLRISLKAD